MTDGARRRARPTRSVTSLVSSALVSLLLVSLTGLLAGCGHPGAATRHLELTGARLTVLGTWTGTEQDRFSQVLHAFAMQTGATVGYRSAEDLPGTIDAALAAGDPPDLALLPQPGLLRRYASSGVLVPLDRKTLQQVQQAYSPGWQALASLHGQQFGVWFKAANKSLLWYNVGIFERAGIAPPRELADLLRTATTLRAEHRAPFAIGAADQWTITDWFENLYLQQAGAAKYDLLTAHKVAWTDPSVLTTLRSLAALLAPSNLAGGLARTLRTTFTGSVAVAFGQRPGAAMLAGGDFVSSEITASTAARIGTDVDVTPFPAARLGVPAIVGGGDVAVQLRRSVAGAALMQFLAGPAAGAIWAHAGGFISPNQQLDLSVYPDPTSAAIARSLIEAGDGFRFDLSDLQPADFGLTPNRGMLASLAAFLITRDVAGTARRLERQATAVDRLRTP